MDPCARRYHENPLDQARKKLNVDIYLLSAQDIFYQPICSYDEGYSSKEKKYARPQFRKHPETTVWSQSKGTTSAMPTVIDPLHRVGGEEIRSYSLHKELQSRNDSQRRKLCRPASSNDMEVTNTY